MAAKSAAPEINITPLIDVMLVLLTMLIVTLPMQMHAVNLDMPGNRMGELQIMDRIDVEFDGTLLWNGIRVDRAHLDERLAALPAGHQVQVAADRLARYDTVAKVMADAQRLGVKDIAIVGTPDYAR